MALEAVIFDWGGTLTPWHTIDHHDCWFAVTGDAGQAAALAAAEASVWALVRHEHRSGTLDDILRAAQVRLSGAQLARYYEWWDEHSYTDPAVPGVLAGLRERGLKVGVLSNTTWPGEQHARIFTRDQVDHLIDAAVYSSELAWAKPHPEAFLAALASLGVAQPDRAVYVGDRLFEDIYGANRVGMRAVLLPHSSIPEGQRGIDGTPDAVIAALPELLDVIDRWLADPAPPG
jgi:putative hydrolase of the HAD superfamily